MSFHLNMSGVLTVTLLDVNGVALNVSSATTKQIRIDGVAKTALFVSDGTDGKLKYTFAVNELSVAGLHTAQAYVVITAGSYTGDKFSFLVDE